jgi:hypothetical protein
MKYFFNFLALSVWLIVTGIIILSILGGAILLLLEDSDFDWSSLGKKFVENMGK